MKDKLSLVTGILFLLISSHADGQQRFTHYRKISPVENAGWHGVILPDNIFSKINRDYSDLRIFEVSGSDTLETPYVLNLARNDMQSVKVDMQPFNKGIANGKLFISFEVPGNHSVNSVELSFEDKNLDALVTVEGSDDRQTWFKLATDQRVVAIFNNNADFKATTISFSESRYKFLRMSINSTKLKLQSATFRKNSSRSGRYSKIDHHYSVREDKQSKMTIVEIEADDLQPVETFSIDLGNGVDYYRYFSLAAVSDSSRAEKEWVYHHTPMTPGYLTSIRPNEFGFTPVWAKKMRLQIFNQDNTPLNIRSITLTRPEAQLIARMSEGKDYFLYYGKKSASPPTYDLVHFTDKIPDNFTTLTLDEEISIASASSSSASGIQNKAWLWAVMGLMIAVLGFFTLKMMKNKQ